MEYSKLISEKHWNIKDKGELEKNRENIFIDDIIQKYHIERKILNNIDGIETVLDAGGGVGRFSIMLAKMGKKVLHLDISDSMLKTAKVLAKNQGVDDKITFVKGALEDLDIYPTDNFDMVISIDAPISYTYPNHEKVISELVRIAKKRIVFSVASRLGALPYCANPLQKNQFILDRNSKDAAYYISNYNSILQTFKYNINDCIALQETGLFTDCKKVIDSFKQGGTPWPITYHFMPDELVSILDKKNVFNIKLSGPGAYARTINNELLVKIMNDDRQREEFLQYCYIYDSNPYVCGMGKDNLVATGEIGEN